MLNYMYSGFYITFPDKQVIFLINNIYTKIFKHKFFNKVFAIYSLATICAIVIIAYMAILNINNSIKSREAEINVKALTYGNNYFEKKISSSRNIVEHIYTTNSLHSEIVYIMNNGYNKHLEYKYDKLLSSTDDKYNGFERYFDSCIGRDSEIVGIGIYSNIQEKAFIYSESGLSIYNKDSLITNYVSKQAESTQGIVIIPSHKANYKGSDDSNVFTVAYQIKDTFSSDILGYISIDYTVGGIKNELNRFINDYKGTVLILTQEGQTIFDSSDRYYHGVCPLYNSLVSPNEENDFFKNNIVETTISQDYGTLTAAMVPLEMLANDKYLSIRKILLIAFLCITATLFFTFIIMKTFSKRVEALMSGIKDIDSGNLSTRISVKSKQDEISEIAESFNNMCDNLNEYIEKVYIADIKQKNAELKALQAQINPHFLYNTLESIRMRAIVDGSRDVAQMIYLLSTLFRNSVKQKSIISIGEEIKYCKMYLELFNMRFIDNVNVIFDVKEDIHNWGILKHSIQPIIENYIIHGIDTQIKDNLLKVSIFKHDGDIYIYVIDNGSGIDEERLKQLKEYIRNPDLESGLSLGLSNVNERIVLLFGNSYGLDLYSESGKGTVVMLKLPAMTREEMERDVQIAGG